MTVPAVSYDVHPGGWEDVLAVDNPQHYPDPTPIRSPSPTSRRASSFRSVTWAWWWSCAWSAGE